MYVNGKAYGYRDGLTLHALLTELRIDRERVVVMRGDAIYRQSQVPDAPLLASDVIEIVSMVQGG